MKIYKVRFLDDVGREVAEFGFYEDELDAEKRRAEVAQKITQKGTLEIIIIEVIPSSNIEEKPAFYFIK